MENRKFKLPFLLVIVIMLFSKCYYDKEEELYKYSNMSACDTANVTYTGTIAPLMINSNCNICHSHAAANGGIILDDYTNLSKNINRVWGSVNHFQGYVAMPQGGNMLSPCDLSKIKAWMNKGNLNN